MSKFAKIFEDEKGKQLLIKIVSSRKEDLEVNNDLQFTIEEENQIVDISVGPMSFKKASEFIENFPEKRAKTIISEGLRFFSQNLPEHYLTNY